MEGNVGHYRALLDGFEEQIALVNAQGRILLVNAAWEQFADDNGLHLVQDWSTVSYLDVCRQSAAGGDDSAGDILHGLQQVMSGTTPLFCAEYPCHSPSVRRWFHLRVAPIYLEERPVFLITHRNITIRRLAEEQAMLDPLTSLPNRRKLDDFLYHEWQRCVRAHAPISCLMVDIDHFKRLNDTEGHLRGDQCLRDMADLLHRFVRRPSDIVSRFGGEEFALILGETPLRDAVAMAEQIRATVMGLASGPASTERDRLTVSIGVASIVPQRGQMETMLIDAADKALYQAKLGGRNRVEVAEQEDLADSKDGALQESPCADAEMVR